MQIVDSLMQFWLNVYLKNFFFSPPNMEIFLSSSPIWVQLSHRDFDFVSVGHMSSVSCVLCPQEPEEWACLGLLITPLTLAVGT